MNHIISKDKEERKIIMRYPSFIKKGDTIGFVAPSFGCATEPYKTAFDHSLEIWKQNGYEIHLGPNCYASEGIGISNTPEKCAEEFEQMYRDQSNVALISCGGGELMCEILGHIDFCALANAKPKWFMGYSDNTNMTFLLPTLTDTAAIYGPNAGAFGMEPWHESLEDTYHLLCGKNLIVHNYPLWEKESKKDEEHPLEPYHVTEPFSLKMKPMVGDVEIKGRLLGGCLDCLRNLVGTRFDRVKEFSEKYKEDGILWFLEACDLNVMNMRCALWNLKEAGWFNHVKGFLIGRPRLYDEPMMGLDQYEAVCGALEEFGVPILMDLDIGHIAPSMPLICGSMAHVKATRQSIEIQMNLC